MFVTKDTITFSLSQKEYINSVLDCGSSKVKNKKYVSCSPTGIAEMEFTCLE